MPRFTFQGLTDNGTPLDGEVVAGNEREALREVERRGLRVLAIATRQDVTRSARTRLRDADVVLCLHELASLLCAGVSLAEAVAAQAEGGHHPRLRAAFGDIAAALRRGEGFSATIMRAGLPLPDYAGILMASGEKSGLLGPAIRDAVQQMEYDLAVRRDVRQALTYPTILVLAGVAAVTLMFTFVVPKFGSLLQRADDLPLLAKVVLGSGMFLHDAWPWVLAVLAGLGALIWRRFRGVAEREALLETLERVPFVGAWRLEAESARWAKVLGLLLANRVPLMDALDLAQRGATTPTRRARLGEVARAVRGGRRLADALEEQRVLTPTGYNLVRVGERAGELPSMLASLARLCDEAGKARMKQFLALLEPIAIVIVGGFIGLIMIGIILAITSANDLAI
jgi:general secretion pathway protein F